MTAEKPSPAPGGPEKPLHERIVSDAPRLGPDDTFRFACHPGVPCFNQCCSNVNIFLSPYDVLRMKRRLGMTSGDFLDRYALLPIQKEMKTPVVLLRMNDDEARTCPFLTATTLGPAMLFEARSAGNQTRPTQVPIRPPSGRTSVG